MALTPQLIPLRLAKVEAMVFRAPIAEPVQTSFGIMLDHSYASPIEHAEGAVGWGRYGAIFPAWEQSIAHAFLKAA